MSRDEAIDRITTRIMKDRYGGSSRRWTLSEWKEFLRDILRSLDSKE
jgi:hypothetical protein